MTSETTTIDTGLDDLLIRNFPGKVVRKDLTKLVKEGANVPVYVLEYLLGSYCASDDPIVMQEGLQTVKKVLAENYVRPDEAEKVKSTIRERGSLKVIDKVTVVLNEKRDVYEALLANLGVNRVEVPSTIVKKFEKLLVGGIWCIVTLEYFFEEDQKKSPFLLRDLKPIQMPNMDMDELFQARRSFDERQWIDVLLRSTGMEPTNFDDRVKWHLLARMLPLVENNYNLAELGPRGTGKSHIYKEISPNSILVSGGQTTVANLFYNLARRQVGLVGLWDVVAFDEVAGISFKDKDGVQIMKDYMASGSFARGRDSVNAYASTVFVGNINQPVDTLVKTSHLFAPFPDVMIDSAFFDRFHAYVPGWEIPKMRPEFFTNQYGLIVDYLAEWLREMRKRNFGDAINKFFKIGRDLNQRDTIAVKHTVSGLLKLLYPNEEYDKEAVRRCLEYALEARRRVKEQLKKIGGMEFFDVHFSYIDNETLEERFISVPEQGGGTLIPDSPLNPGVMHTVATGASGRLGLYRLETQVTTGTGALKTSGMGSNSQAKEAIKVGFDYFRANACRVSASIKSGDRDFHLHVVELHNCRRWSESAQNCRNNK
jgi:ATP-dependent Lon protease